MGEINFTLYNKHLSLIRKFQKKHFTKDEYIKKQQVSVT